MHANVGTVDRVVRVVIGVALLSLLFLVNGNERWWGLLGIVPVGTAALRNCPLYSIVGLSTCPSSDKKSA